MSAHFQIQKDGPAKFRIQNVQEMANLSFLQKVFNKISLLKNENLWLSSDDRKLEERFKLLAEFPDTKFSTQLKLDSAANTKNVKLSLALREKGNLCYAQGDSEKALQLYNQSLQYAPDPLSDEDIEDDNNSMAIAFANRSAVWMDRKDYFLALRDAQLAFENNYPKEIHHKLLERIGRCHLAMSEHSKAIENFEKAIVNIEQGSNKGERMKSRVKMIRDLVKECNSRMSEQKRESQPQKYLVDLVPHLANPHPKFPAFSDSVEVKYGGPDVGRFCVASKVIEPGELLAVETPFVWLLDKEESRSHCWNCFRSVIAPVPCLSCSAVVFCGLKCRTEANYHEFECQLTEVLYRAQIGGWALAYRAMISKPLDYFLTTDRKKFEVKNELLGSEKLGEVYHSTDIISFHNLVTHTQQGKKQPPELMMQALAAIFLLRCLEAKSYYKRPVDVSDTDLTDTEIYLLKLLHHFMRITYYNTHEITTTEENEVAEGLGPEKLQMRRIGRATNPSLALLNHSCDPNYRRISVGNKTLGFATKRILPGEEITDTYSPTFAAASREDRWRGLSKYNFTCRCIACRDNWPTLGDMDRSLHGLPNECYKMNSKDEIKVQLKRISTADHLIAKIVREPKPDLIKLLSLVKRHYEEINKLIHPPHHAITMAENKLYHVLLAIFASKSNIHFSV